MRRPGFLADVNKYCSPWPSCSSPQECDQDCMRRRDNARHAENVKAVCLDRYGAAAQSACATALGAGTPPKEVALLLAASTSSPAALPVVAPGIPTEYLIGAAILAAILLRLSL